MGVRRDAEGVRGLVPEQRLAGSTELRVPFSDSWMTDEARTRATRVLASGWVTTGAETAALECEVAERAGARHAVAVASTSAAMELALRSLDLPARAPVLVSTMSSCDTIQAVLHAGLTPVLVDVDQTTGRPSCETVAKAVRETTPQALVAGHWSGDPVDVAELAEAAALPRERVVEDATHALGAERDGRRVGSGSTVCFDFYATQHLPLGEGGLITTDDAERASWCRRARSYGKSADAWRRYLPDAGWQYDVAEGGLRANLSDLQAAIGRGQLLHFDEWQARRAEIAARYDARLAGLPGLLLPHRPGPAEGRHAWQRYVVRTVSPSVSRDHLVARLAARGVGTSAHFVPLHHLDYYAREAVLPETGLRGADALARGLLSLPLHPRLTDSQVDLVCEVMAGVLDTGWMEVTR